MTIETTTLDVTFIRYFAGNFGWEIQFYPSKMVTRLAGGENTKRTSRTHAFLTLAGKNEGQSGMSVRI